MAGSRDEIEQLLQAHSDALRDCFAKGMSFAQIARELNVRFGTRYTRSAVLGRGKRIGLAARDPGLRTGFIPGPASASAPGQASGRARRSIGQAIQSRL